ncbi:MAG: twin-arginine translocation pathway signal protein [Gemmatimonadetes bacterium]|nr:MAG: twin-arginine translocation pathway signal protein [Gemmatimonadota bacterium]PYO68400.1 MAG: twin-arginine translocation pathway signal protein [Gemmatimonadota bacterium]PYO81339.1 MAG: twin-arginine translocation pathway signal protein [Gemmatimonadota bacterium]PYP64380.1 MAG: twin-arginine translocation pathway signal protein [Gemmatimonadota bacterium]
MDRREALRVLGAATAVPLVSRDLLALGRDAHARWRARPGFRVLDADQQALVTTLTDLIIPETDTPGARAARVDQFVDVMLADWYDPDDRQRFLDGLADVDARSTAATGKPFTDATPAQQTALLTTLDDELARLREAHQSTSKSFFRMLKWLTLVGYYTSQIGFEQELHERIIPGMFDPCRLQDAAARGGED